MVVLGISGKFIVDFIHMPVKALLVISENKTATFATGAFLV